MGTLEGTKTDLKFDDSTKQWLFFKQQVLERPDSQNFGCMVEGGHGICAILQMASAAAAKGKVAGKTGTISLDMGSYKTKVIETEFKKHP